MSMPGFSADAALYKTGGHYHTTKVLRPADGNVHPAQALDWSCYKECHKHCHLKSAGPGLWGAFAGIANYVECDVGCQKRCGSTQPAAPIAFCAMAFLLCP
jgi:hypothetical protein